MDSLKLGHKNTYEKMPITQITPRYNFEKRSNMSQVQLCIGFPTFGNSDPDKYILDIINVVLAGPMSSRLFVTLRTKYGLAYNVGSSTSLNKLSGDFTISCGVDGKGLFTHKLIENSSTEKSDPIRIILDEVFNIKNNSITKDELQLAQDYIKGNTILDSEDSISISQYYGRQRIVNESLVTIKEYLNIIENIRLRDIDRVTNRIFSKNRINISIIGNVDENKFNKYMKNILDLY